MPPREEPIGVSLLPIAGSVRRLVRHSQLVVARAAKAHGLLVSDMNALARIVDWGGVSTGILAQSLPLDQSSVTDLADRLERAKLAKRVRSTKDRRVVLLEPTAAGIKVINESFGPVFTTLAGILEGMSPAEREVVGRFLDRADHAVDEWLAEPAAQKSAAKTRKLRRA